MNILLIEDDVGLVELITANLEESGFSVVSTASGAEALAHLQQQTPDLMLLDYSLPDMSGKELIETFINQQTTPPPFIITTGQGDERIAVDMMKLGAMDYLTKDILFLERLPVVVKRVIKEIESDGKLRQAEDAFKESAERFKMISENAPVLINSFAKDGRCLFWNKQCEKTFGWTIEEINEQAVPMALFYPDPAVCEAVVRSVTTDPDGNFREWHPLTKEGKKLSMMWANYSLPTGQIFSMGHDITERKREEKILGVELELFEYAINHSEEELLRKFLDEAEKLTDSTIGFYHYIEEDQESISLQAWSSNTLNNMCKGSGEAMLHYPISKAGVWMDCIKERKPVVHNDYESLPHKKGLPEGHALIIREVVVPVIRGNQIMAVLGVGNKKIDYNEADVKCIQHFADAAWETVVRKQAEEKTRIAEQNLKNTFDLSPSIICKVNLDTGCFIEVNQAVTRILGYTVEEFTATPFIELIHPDDQQTSTDEQVEQLKGKEVAFFENRYLCKDGTYKWMAWHGTKADENGIVTAIGSDITERKRAEEETKKNQILLQQAESISNQGAWEWDIVEDEWTFSENWLRIHGCRSSGITREELMTIAYREDVPEVEQAFEEALKEGTLYNIEHRIIRKNDGEIRYIRAQGKVVLNDSGQCVKMVGVAQDITERRQTEMEKERLIAAVEQSAESIVITNAKGEIEYVNPSFERITGYSRAEALGKNPRILKSGRQDEAFYADLWRTITSGEIWRGQMINQRKDGTFYTESNVISPVNDSAGKIINFVAVKTDITQELLREEKARQTQKMEAIGQLAGGVAHDFNNQLSGILGYAEILIDSLKDEQQIKDATLIKEGALRAANLTAQLLAFSHKGQVLSCPVSIHKNIEEVAGILAHSIDKNITIRQRLNADPETTQGDPNQLQNAFLNIAINARDAMPDGGELTFETEITELDENSFKGYQEAVLPGTYIMISIADNGCGMEAETQKHIFEPFYTTKDVGQGTGMGLASVYGTIQNHKGAISVYSAMRHGTTFRIYLPLCKQTDIPEQTEKNMKPATTGTARILVVDDEETIRKFAMRALERQGYQVITCSDGKEAVEYYEKSWREIDLVLLDMIMPVMGGGETFALMKKINPEIRAILSSGYSVDGAAQAILNDGVKAFIRKPYRLIELSEKVEQILQ